MGRWLGKDFNVFTFTVVLYQSSRSVQCEVNGDVVMCCQSTLSSQSQVIATLTSKLSLRESNYERHGHELQQMKDRQQELATSVRELARRAAAPATALPGLELCSVQRWLQALVQDFRLKTYFAESRTHLHHRYNKTF